VQVTAEHLAMMLNFASMEVLIGMLLFYDFDVCGRGFHSSTLHLTLSHFF